jgi:GDP-L-galactose phosphorylase
MAVQVTEGGRNLVVQLNDKWSAFTLKEYYKSFEALGCLKLKKSYDGLLLCIAQGEKDKREVVPSTSPPKDGLLLTANVCFRFSTVKSLPSFAI